MATESGSIYAKLLLDESAFIASLKSALNNANDTFGKIIGLGDKTAQAFDKTQKSISGMGRENTLAGLSERLQRLNGILDKTQIGSQRFQQIQKEIDNTKTKIDEAGNRLGAFGKIFDTLGKVGINLPVAGIAGAIAGLSSVVSIAGDYERQTVALKTATQATGEEFELLKSKARELGSTTSFSAKEAAEGMTELAKAGLDTNQVLGATEHVLNMSIVGEMGIAEAATIAADSMSQFGLAAKDAAGAAQNMQRISDTMSAAAAASSIGLRDVAETFKYAAGTANTLSISIEKTAAMTAALAKDGIKASSAGTALKAVLLNLAAPGSSQVKALAQMGLSEKDLKDSKGNLKDIFEIFKTINQKTQGMGNSQKAGIFKDLFGTESISAAMSLVKYSVEETKNGKNEIVSVLADFEGKVSDKGFAQNYANQLSNNFQGAVKSLQSATEEIVLLIGDLVLPIVRPLTEVANVIINVLGSAIRFLIKPFQLLFAVIDQFISKSAQGFLILTGVALAFKSVIVAFAPQIIAALTPLWAFLMANPFVLAIAGAVVAIAALITYWDDLKTAVQPTFDLFISAFNMIVDSIKSVKDVLAELWPSFGEGGGILETIVGYVKEFWKWLSESKIAVTVLKVLFAPIVIFINLISIGIAAFASALKIVAGIAADLKEKFLSIKDSLGINFDPVKQKAAEFWNYIKSVFNFTGLIDSVKSAFSGMFDKSSIGDSISKMFSGINLSSLFASLNAAGQKVINDFLGYLKREFPKTFQMFSWLANSISETLTYILNRVKSFFTDLMDSMKRGWENIKKYFSSETEQAQPGAKPTDKPKSTSAPVFATPGAGTGKTKEAVEDLDQFLKRAIAIDKMGKEGVEFKVSMPLEEFKFNQKEIEKFAKDNKIQIATEYKYNKDSKDSVKAEAELVFKIPDGVTEKEKEQLLSKLKRMQATADSGSIKPIVDPQVKTEPINQLHGEVIKLNEDIEKIGKSGGLEKFARSVQAVSNTFSQIGAGFTELLNATAKLASVKFDNFKQNLSFLAQGMTKLIDDNLKNTINKINEETNLKVKGYDDQLAALKAQKQAELELEQQFQNDMKLLKAQMDADAKAENDRLFEEAWAKRQADYDNQRALIEAGTADATEKAVSEQALLAQAEEEKAALKAQFDQRLVDQVANTQSAIDAKTEEHNTAKEAKDKERDDKEKAINDAKTAFLAEQENKRTQAQDAAEQKKNEIKRNSALIEWALGRSAFEANKRAQAAAVQISLGSTIMNGVAAMAMITAQAGIPGIIIGAAFLGLITALSIGAAAASLAAINSAQYPPPPIMAEGGLIGGQPHSAGGTMVNAERGEFIVNAADTAKNIDTLQSINSGSFNAQNNSGQNINIYIGDTKIFSGQNMSADSIARVASERIRQDIYQAVSR